MTDMDGGGFLAQGGYGCVFYPEVNCQGKDTNNKNFLSKIVQKDFSAENEIRIGKLLSTKLKMWVENPLQNHFAPVLSSCNVDVSKFAMDEHEKCTLFEKKQTADFVLMKILTKVKSLGNKSREVPPPREGPKILVPLEN